MTCIPFPPAYCNFSHKGNSFKEKYIKRKASSEPAPEGSMTTILSGCPVCAQVILCMHGLSCVSTSHPVCARAVLNEHGLSSEYMCHMCSGAFLCVHGLSSEYTGHPVCSLTVLCEHRPSCVCTGCPLCAWVQRHTHLAHHQVSPFAFGTAALSSLCLFPLIAAALLLCPQSFCSTQLLFQEDSGPFLSCQHLHLQIVMV